MSDYEPRDVSPPDSAEIPNDHPSIVAQQASLGFCTRQRREVKKWDCKRCFWDTPEVRDAHRDLHGRPRRSSCVERHIEGPRRLAEREAQVVRLRPLLEQMGGGDFEGVVKNTLESALAHPDEETSMVLLRQIEAHAEHAQETPDPGDVDCEVCGGILSSVWNRL